MSLSLLVIAILLIILAFVGGLFTFYLDDAIKSTKCTLATMSYDFLEGTNYDETSFIGLTNAIDEIDILKENVKQAPSIIGGSFTDTEWVTTDEDELYERINDIEKAH